ncbi:unnamed protein product, partial [Cyprideis torosa]
MKSHPYLSPVPSPCGMRSSVIMRSVPSAAEFLGLRTPLQEAKEQLEEMQLIYSRLYSDSSADHEWASDRIQSLKFRFVRLSVGMECSLRLLRAISAHVSLPPNAHARDADTAESLLALAIVRFIGLVTEKEQKRLKTIPMQSLAREMGIGEDIVNLRHQAAHSELPAVDRLFDAATRAFHWLKREFWELEIKRLQAAVNHMEMKIERESSKVQASQDHLKRALDRYLTLKNMQFQGKEPVNPQELRKALAKAISHLCEAEAVSSTAIDLLLKNLLPSEDQEDDEISPSVETEFFQLWQPLMEGMPRTLLIQLLYALLRYQSTNRAAVRRATEWATFLSSKQSALHVEPADLTHTALLNATLSNTEVLLPSYLQKNSAGTSPEGGGVPPGKRAASAPLQLYAYLPTTNDEAKFIKWPLKSLEDK